MRATSHLQMVYVFHKDSYYHMDFGSATISPQFMQCDHIMKVNAWKCKTCENNLMFCKNCVIGCHRGHEMKCMDVEYDLKKDNVKCECNEKGKHCIFSK